MSKKTPDKQQREPYLKIPAHILNLPDIGLCEKVLLAHIYSFGSKGCWQSNKTIAKIFMVSKRTIQIWLSAIKKYIFVRNPKGYYRTIWSKSQCAKNCADVRKNTYFDCAKNGIRLRKNLRTTNNNTITENYKRTIASPSPAPFKGASATLQHRREKNAKTIEDFKLRLGSSNRWKPLSQDEFNRHRQLILAQLQLDKAKEPV